VYANGKDAEAAKLLTLKHIKTYALCEGHLFMSVIYFYLGIDV